MMTAADLSVAPYQLTFPRRVLFGWGRIEALPAELQAHGGRVWAVVGSRTLQRQGLVASLQERAAAHGVRLEVLVAETGEPQVADVDRLVEQLRGLGVHGGDRLLALGGGSTLDLVKAAAGLVPNRHVTTVRDVLEGVGRGLALTEPPLEWIAVPTTAGTGSEATRNAVISSNDPPFKKSFRHEALLPALVLIDPQLTVSVPPAITAATGLDAITQLLESGLSRKATPLTRALCEAALPGAWSALPLAVADGTHQAAREALAHGAFVSGVTLANAGLGIAHAIAAAVGAAHRATHGVACAVLLPHALEFNRDVGEAWLAAQSRRLLQAKFPTDAESVSGLIDATRALLRQVGLPERLRECCHGTPDWDQLIELSQGNSLSGNPRQVSREELRQVLQTAW